MNCRCSGSGKLRVRGSGKEQLPRTDRHRPDSFEKKIAGDDATGDFLY
jgi:hypothetical protein